MQVILSGKSQQSGQSGRCGQGQGRLRPQLPYSARQSQACHRVQHRRVQRQARRTGKETGRNSRCTPRRAARNWLASCCRYRRWLVWMATCLALSTTIDIAEALVAQGFDVAKAEVRMPNGPLKTVGDHPVSIALHHDVVVDITVSVLGEH